jgi:hypothetical protein
MSPALPNPTPVIEIAVPPANGPVDMLSSPPLTKTAATFGAQKLYWSAGAFTGLTDPAAVTCVSATREALPAGSWATALPVTAVMVLSLRTTTLVAGIGVPPPTGVNVTASVDPAAPNPEPLIVTAVRPPAAPFDVPVTVLMTLVTLSVDA